MRHELARGAALLTESQLMAQLGVSRPTLREAFHILEAESLINVRRGVGGGAHVLPPDPAVGARYMGLLLQSTTPRSLTCTRPAPPLSRHAQAWSRTTYEFHELVLRSSGNKMLELQGTLLQEVVATHCAATVADNFAEDARPQRFRRVLLSFRTLAGFVADGNRDGGYKHRLKQMRTASTTACTFSVCCGSR